MIKTSAPRRAISAALAFVLAATLIPSEALPEAYAATADSAQSQTQDEATDETSDATEATEEATSSSDATSAGNRPAGIVSATERITDGTEESSAASSSASAAAPIDMTRASVSLTSGDTTPTLISQAGLTFQVNDDAETVSVVGIDPAADIAHLVIPQTVVSVGREYPVTAIMCGGGVDPSLLILPLVR